MTPDEWQDLARHVLDLTELADIRVERAAMRSQAPSDEEMEVDANISLSGSQKGDGIVVRAKYATSAHEKSDANAEDAKPMWQVNVTVAGLFVGENLPEFGSEELKAFSFTVGLMSLHPYARQFIQSAVSHMGHSPYTMELLRAEQVFPDEGDEEE